MSSLIEMLKMGTQRSDLEDFSVARKVNIIADPSDTKILTLSKHRKELASSNG